MSETAYAPGPMPSPGDRPSALERRDVRCPLCGRRAPAAGCPEHRSLDNVLTAADDPEPAPAIDLPAFPGYRVLGILGRGGFGTVFEAAREGDGGKVAIKLARQDRGDAAARLHRERIAL